MSVEGHIDDINSDIPNREKLSQQRILMAMKKIHNTTPKVGQEFTVVVNILNSDKESDDLGIQAILGTYGTYKEAQDVVAELFEETGIHCARTQETYRFTPITLKQNTSDDSFLEPATRSEMTRASFNEIKNESRIKEEEERLAEETARDIELEMDPNTIQYLIQKLNFAKNDEYNREHICEELSKIEIRLADLEDDINNCIDIHPEFSDTWYDFLVEKLEKRGEKHIADQLKEYWDLNINKNE